MFFFRRRRNAEKPTRQQRRKLQRDVAKLKRKVRRQTLRTLADPRIPQWIRDIKRRQLERPGFLEKTLKNH